MFGYEEALGYCVDPEHVKDKDGVSALLLLCELAAAEKAQGRTLVDVLDDLALAHGLHATDQLSVRVTDLAEIAAADGAAAGHAARRARRARRSSRSTTSPGARRTCRRPTGCATGCRRRPGDRAARAAPSRSSSATSRSSSRCDAEAGVDAARISAAGAARRAARRPQGRRRHLSRGQTHAASSATTNADREHRQRRRSRATPSAGRPASRARTPPPTGPRCPGAARSSSARCAIRSPRSRRRSSVLVALDVGRHRAGELARSGSPAPASADCRLPASSRRARSCAATGRSPGRCTSRRPTRTSR